MQWFRKKKVQFSCLQSMHICRAQNNDNLVHATIRRARCRMAIPHDDLCEFSCDRSKNSRDHYVGQSHFSRDSIFVVRIITCPTCDNPLRYSLASYHTGISTNWDFAGSQNRPWKKRKESFIRRHTGEGVGPSTVWRDNAVRTPSRKRRWGKGGGGSNWWEKERRRESNARTREKKKPDEVTERGGRRGRTDGPAVLTLTRPEVEVGWDAAGPSCRAPLAPPRPPSSPLLPRRRALPRFYLLCPAALRAHRRAPPGLPCSSAFADSSIKDITKSTLDENTLPLYRGVPRERRAKTLCLLRPVCTDTAGPTARHSGPRNTAKKGPTDISPVSRRLRLH